MSHQNISFVKSGLRLVACIMLFPFSPMSALLLGIAEGVGIWEEIGY